MPELLEQTATDKTTYTELGYVCDVQGNQLRVRLSDEYLTSAKQNRAAQIASFVVIPLQHGRIIGLIDSITFDDNNNTGYIAVHLLGQINDGKFLRGVNSYPLPGDIAITADQNDLDAIFNKTPDSPSENTTDLLLGQFAMNTDYNVYLSGQHFFTKHAAVLGNSGAGKSWTVSRIISEAIKHQNTQIILFDLHGEYRQAFSNPDGSLKQNITYIDESDLIVPYWLLTYNEMETLFVDTSDTRLIPNQTGFLKQALMKLKKLAAKNLDLLTSYNVDTPIYFSLEQLKLYAENMNQARFVLNTNRYAFSKNALRNLPPEEQEQLLLTQKVLFNQGNAEGEVPHATYYHSLTGLLDLLEQKLNDKRYNFLLRPIEHARTSKLFSSIFPQITEERDDWSEMIAWLLKIFTGDITPRRNLTIIDLSGIPYEIIDLTVGLLTRMIFDFNFYTPADVRRPIVLVFEEAHNYIPAEPNQKGNFARVAIERVAKEGRKYGVSAVVVSQRPRDLSPTVLSQCNNVIAMRISNPDDQFYVSKIVSDQFASLISMLPVLRPGESFVIGDSVPMPLRTLIAKPETPPASDNVDFIKAWQQTQHADQMEQTIKRWMKQHRPNKKNT